MSAVWEVGSVISYASEHGNALLLVLEHEEIKQDDGQVLGVFERTMVLWGSGEYAQDVGGSFMWDMSLGVTTRIT